MAEETIYFMFNTPITGVTKTTGKYEDETHTALVLPIRGEFMQIDGASGCRIDRFGFYVEFFNEMTDRNTVVEAVKGIIAKFGQKPVESGYFPLRGEKTPEASSKIAEKKKTNWRYKKVSTSIDSLTEYVTVDDDPNKFDAAEFNRRVKSLVEKLGNFNGVTEVEVTMTSVGVTFDSRITGFDQIRAHIKNELNAARESGDYFPHVEADAELKFALQNWDIRSVVDEES